MILDWYLEMSYGSFMPLPGACLPSFPGTVLSILPLPLWGRQPYAWRSSLCLGDCGTHKEARDLFMRLQDILKTSAPQEQDNRNRVNFKRSPRVSGLRSWPQMRIQASFRCALKQLRDMYSDTVRLTGHLYPTQGLLLMSKEWCRKMILKWGVRTSLS